METGRTISLAKTNNSFNNLLDFLCKLGLSKTQRSEMIDLILDIFNQAEEIKEEENKMKKPDDTDHALLHEIADKLDEIMERLEQQRKEGKDTQSAAQQFQQSILDTIKNRPRNDAIYQYKFEPKQDPE